jgi:hypothetical protein
MKYKYIYADRDNYSSFLSSFFWGLDVVPHYKFYLEFNGKNEIHLKIIW